MRNALWLLLCLGSLVAAQSRAADPTFEVLTSASDNPSFLADPGDGRLFITELGGHIRIFQNGQLQAPNDAFLDLSGLVAFGAAGEGGMHSMAFDPNYGSNRFFYVEYTRTGSGGSPLETVIARYTTQMADPNHADPNSVQIVLTQQSPVGANFSNHKGGQLQFGPDGFLYFGFGDGGSGNDPMCLSQTRDVFFGKLLRIDPSGDDFPDANRNYAIPSSNPFRGANDPNDQYRDEIWDLGLRNPYRFSFDRQTGELWIGDVGQDTREEVDNEPRFNAGGGGRNYGWKVFEGNLCHFPDPQGAGNCPAYVGNCSDPGYTAPVADYDHSDPNVGTFVGETVIGGYVYRGSVAAWQGTYIFADYIASKIFALTPNGSGGFDRSQISAPNVHSPISFGEDHMGELYVMAGNVYKINFSAGVAFSKQQQACVSKLNDGFANLADARAAQVRTCVDRLAAGKLGTTIDQCLSAPSSKLDKLAARNTATDANQCVDPLPPFGHGGAAAGNAAALDADVQTLLTDTLSETPDAAVILKTDDKTGAACQKAVLKTLAACTRAHREEFLRCKLAGLKNASFADASDLAGCLDSDPKSRVQKACVPKLATALDKSCVRKGVALSTAFPVCATGDAAALADCLASSARCRTCELFDAADALGVDCTGACP